MDLPGRWIDRVREQKALEKIILDLDSSVSETYGRQEGSAHNGHFECTCFHPLFCFNHLGDLERALLRNGNVASANDWRSVIEPVVTRYRNLDLRKFFRGDAAFAIREVYEDDRFSWVPDVQKKSKRVGTTGWGRGIMFKMVPDGVVG